MTTPDGLDALLAHTVERLTASGVHDEALGAFKPSRGVAIFRTADAFVPTGRAWRLGVLLLDRAGALFELGEVTRAVEPKRAAVNRSPAGEERRAYRAAASRSAFPVGEAINFNYRSIPLDAASLVAGSGPLFVGSPGYGAVGGGGAGGQVRLIVDPASGGSADLEHYLAERVAILGGDYF